MAKVGIEIPAILFFFALSFTVSITTNLCLYRTCYVILGYNESECALLGTGSNSSEIINIEKKVQPYANVISMVQSCIESLIAPILCFFIGSWTDRHGRRPILLSGILAFTISYLILLVIYLIPNASPWFFLLTSIPVVLSGGFPSLMTMMLCCVSDATSQSDRGVRMGLFDGSILIGGLIGTLTNAYAFKAGGYVMIYSISATCGILAFLYVLFVIPELVVREDNKTLTVKTSSPFQTNLLIDTFKTAFKRRENSGRLLLVYLLIIVTTAYFTFIVGNSLIFLYCREKFQWSLQIYNFYTSYVMLMFLMGSSLGIYVLHKLLNVAEQYLLTLGFFAIAISSVMMGIVEKGWLLYIAATLKFFGAFVSPMSRSLISKTVEENETGKIFSIISGLESVTGLAGAPLYTYIYNSTLNVYPGIFNFVTAGFSGIGLLFGLLIIIFKRSQRQATYDILDEEVTVIN